MDVVKIGGLYYGMDIQKSMEKSHEIMSDSIRQVWANDQYMQNILIAMVDEYEYVFREVLRDA